MAWRIAMPRLRSGMAPKVCGSFQPRVTGGRGMLEADHQIDAWKRYKKAMDGGWPKPAARNFLRLHRRRGG
jgi:hypothetical protein